MSAGFEKFGLVGGDYMAYAGALPWHKLGQGLPGLATAAEMIQAAKLDWTVSTRRLHYVAVDGNVSQIEWEAADAYGVVRDDSNTCLGVVGTRYTPVQNESLFSFFDNIVKEGEAIYETAGSLHGGKKVWILATIPSEMIIWRNGEKDVAKKHILLCNSHDGTQSVRCYFTEVRVVCQNTLTASTHNASNKVSIRHTASVEARLKEAHNLMGFITEYYQEMQNELQFLADAKIKEVEDLMDFFDELWPDTGSTQANNRQKKVQNIWKQEKDRYGNNWLSALNAVTGYVDHLALPEPTEKRMDQILFGIGANKKEAAFDLCLKKSHFPGVKK